MLIDWLIDCYASPGGGGGTGIPRTSWYAYVRMQSDNTRTVAADVMLWWLSDLRPSMRDKWWTHSRCHHATSIFNVASETPLIADSDRLNENIHDTTGLNECQQVTKSAQPRNCKYLTTTNSHYSQAHAPRNRSSKLIQHLLKVSRTSRLNGLKDGSKTAPFKWQPRPSCKRGYPSCSWSWFEHSFTRPVPKQKLRTKETLQIDWSSEA